MEVVRLFMTQKGLFFCLGYGVSMAVQANIGKVLTYSSRASYLTFIRCVSLIFVLPLAEWEAARACNNKDLIIYLIVSIVGVIPYGSAVLSFTLMGVGDSNSIEFGGSLILVGVIGHFALDEKLSITYFMLLLVDFAGIVLVVKPSFIFKTSEGDITSKEIGAIVALTGALFFAVWPVLVRKLAKRNTLHCYLLTALHGLIGMIISTAWTTLDSAWEVPESWLNGCIILAYGVMNTIQFVLAFKSLANADAKTVSMALTLSVALSYVLQLTVFGEDADWVSIGGAIIILLCVVLSSCWDLLQVKLDRFQLSYEELEDS
ncbi:hypothetical protein HOLleu_04573 [Holothuria leucospilota]|uniref:EamA domain-containing protein n=1 Tax=Holothuria leucospilota TaxID=206669 RepID=A0A9Q1CS84_HOLLE|nr:hypothetical protein HOLleu_04573 [Holothuria leucospilota]